MRLKSIKLAGFKSFVDPTTVHFPSNMCGVVGPNGCGKSNIIDAVRWVMGESSAKHLRGESMTDVIFKGSNSRKPAGLASVELIFDNNEGRVTGEFAAYREISVRRTVSSDAKNTYYLNGSKCRRKDIMDIFLGTGLGPRSYAIISQGIISNLIESKPEELRVFIEEAAGISRYKERRRETENRIRRTQENLERLTDLRDELGRQLGHLERQAKAAEQYKTLKAEERLKKAQLMALKWQTVNSGAQSQEQTMRELEVQVEAAIAEQRNVDANMEADRITQLELNDRLSLAQSDYYRLGNEITRLEQTIAHKSQRAKELQDDLAQVEQNLHEAREQRSADQLLLDEQLEELMELEPELELLQENEMTSADALQSVEEQIQQWQQQWDRFNQSSQEPKRIAEVEQSRIIQAEQIMLRLVDRESRLRAELAKLNNDDENLLIEQLAEQFEELTEQAHELELQLEQSTESVEHQRDQLQQLAHQQNNNRDELSRLHGRQSSLEALHQASLNQDSGTTAWLQAHQLTDTPRLMDSLSVESGWERAVETALADSLNALQLDDLSPLAYALNDLEHGAVMVMDHTSPQPYSPHFSALPALADKLHGDNGQHLLAGIFAADSLEHALTHRHALTAAESIITKDGIWLGANWLKVRNGVDDHAGVLERQRELESLASRCETLEQESDTIAAAQDNAQTLLSQFEAQRDQQLRQLSELNRQRGELNGQLGSQKAKVEQSLHARKRLKEDLNDVVEQQQQEQEVITESRFKLQDAMDKMEDDIEQREILQQQRESLLDQLEIVRERARGDKDRSHQLALRHQSLTTQANSLKAALERLNHQISKQNERLQTINEAMHDASSPEGEMREQLEELLTQHLDAEGVLQQVRTAVDEVEHRLRGAEKTRHAAEQRAQQFRDKLEKHRLDWHGMQILRTTLAEQLAADNFDLTTIVDNLPEGATADEWQQSLDQIANRIERLGAINLAAIEEFETQSERKRYLDQQNDDLESALNTLEGAIRKIDQETRSRFRTTFDQVNSGLQELFPRVFGGGQAYLALTGDDLLDTGVTIMAQPPGKKNSTIHLLSGGEKALTAIALVFAIFQLNPSPFCMLDEVDAPLDDANVGRYANMVSQMSEKVQFIYITHNKIAMQAASQLIGVTMHEPGVSRPVSVDVEQAAALAEQ